MFMSDLDHLLAKPVTIIHEQTSITGVLYFFERTYFSVYVHKERNDYIFPVENVVSIEAGVITLSQSAELVDWDIKISP